MKQITNTSEKIINIGSMILLPQETKALPKEYQNSEVLDFLQKRGAVEMKEENAEQSFSDKSENAEAPEDPENKEDKEHKRGTAAKK